MTNRDRHPEIREESAQVGAVLADRVGARVAGQTCTSDRSPLHRVW